MDLNDEAKRKNLFKLIKQSKARLRPFLDNYKELVEAYTGDMYGPSGNNKKRTIINFMATAADVQTMSLVGHRPRCTVSSHYQSLVPFAGKFEQTVNNLATEIRLDETLRDIVLDSFFMMGIAKLYRAPSGEEIAYENPELPAEPGPFASDVIWKAYQDKQNKLPHNIWIDPGKPMVERVSPDDFIWDMSANSWEKIRFAVHEYRVPVEDLENDSRMDQELVKKTKPTSKFHRGSVYEESEDQVKDISTGNTADQDDDELTPMTTVMDVWLPHTRQWAIMLADQPEIGPLYEEEWDGPESGPFYLLTLISDVPDNILPVSAAARIKHMHNILNSLMRKLVRQSARQKEVNFFRNQKDGEQFRTANDGDFRSVQDPNSITTIRSGGIDQQSYSFFQGLESLASQYAGNIHAMAGMGPQADTATQESLIHGRVSAREARMRQNVVAFASKIFAHMGWMLWVDETHDSVTKEEIPGVPAAGAIESHWTPEEREGDFLQYNFQVEASSMPYQSPAERVQSVNDILQNILIPMGVQPNLEKLIDFYAEYLDQPKLRDVIDMESMKDNPPPAGPRGSSKPAETYDRRDTQGRAPYPDKNQMAGNVEQSDGMQPEGGY
jgi:hypothetical protein